MGELLLEPTSALTDVFLPFDIETVTLSEVPPASIISIAPFKGQGIEVNTALKKAINLTLPKTGEMLTDNGSKMVWIGHGLWFAIGHDLEIVTSALEGKAAITDQSDAWCVLHLSGDIQPILARLTSFDFSQMQKNGAARTEFAKLSAILTPTDNGVEIMLRRSAALWAIKQIKQAMINVSAIDELKK